MKKKGFTLIELLAVIIILAVIALIATPIVLNVVDNAKESARKSSVAGYADATRMAIYDYQFANKGATPEVNKTWADENVTTGGEKVACEEVKFSNTGVILKACQVESNEKKYCFANGKVYDDCNDTEFLEKYEQNVVSGPKKCTFKGEMKQGAEFVDGQYIYRYMQKIVGEDQGSTVYLFWNDTSEEGWTVHVNPDYKEAAQLTTPICSEINGKPIVNTSYTFFITTTEISLHYNTDFSDYSAFATKINLKNIDTSNVIDMSNMFSYSHATSLDLNSFDTSKVTNMNSMFWHSQSMTLNLSSFDTSNVTDMRLMFSNSQATTLDLSSFDTSNVTDMGDMFKDCAATVGYARTQEDADRFNNAAVTGIPDTLRFVVKEG